jgi:hypothetical protein
MLRSARCERRFLILQRPPSRAYCKRLARVCSPAAPPPLRLRARALPLRLALASSCQSLEARLAGEQSENRQLRDALATAQSNVGVSKSELEAINESFERTRVDLRVRDLPSVTHPSCTRTEVVADRPCNVAGQAFCAISSVVVHPHPTHAPPPIPPLSFLHRTRETPTQQPAPRSSA